MRHEDQREWKGDGKRKRERERMDNMKTLHNHAPTSSR